MGRLLCRLGRGCYRGLGRGETAQGRASRRICGRVRSRGVHSCAGVGTAGTHYNHLGEPLVAEFLSEYGLFLAKAITFLVVALVLLFAMAGLALRNRRGPSEGYIEVKRLNERFDDLRAAVQSAVWDQATFKKQQKAEKKARKQRDKKGAGDEGEQDRVFVLDFFGDMEASAVEYLREEVSAVLLEARAGDEVVLRLESPGGMVHSYGLAASQVERLRAKEGLTVTIAVDRVAASGGYLMAALGHKILAAPFAILGSIGVVAQVPNVHRLLKKNDVDVEVLTAGEYKRTLTVLGENTEQGRAKFLEELEDVHRLFKASVQAARPSLSVEAVATGESWFGTDALARGLCDALETSDSYLLRRAEEAELFEVRWTVPQSPVERLLQGAQGSLGRALEGALGRLLNRSAWLR
ncbi:MAG: protease SohB [Pseudomonadales bacterium]|nr:protease SohB [Pseudomonadales bacterium]MBL6808709.1 protease SohB [Pseudomonadales bacterium]